MHAVTFAATILCMYEMHTSLVYEECIYNHTSCMPQLSTYQPQTEAAGEQYGTELDASKPPELEGWLCVMFWLKHILILFYVILSADFLTALMPILCHSSVPSKWKLFGVLLKVPPSSLDNIEAKYPHNPQQGLMEMLQLWQKKVDPPPSWDTVIEALKDLEEEQLALEVERIANYSRL